MREFRCCVPCLLGLEGPIADELKRLGLSDVRSENGRVWFTGGPEAVARANLGLRCGERVLIELGHFPARSFEELFQGARALPWEELIPANGAFPVTGHSLNSQLHSVPDCQRTLKKALAERLGRAYGLGWLPEDGAAFPVRFSLMKDQVSLCLDTSG
ncbi:MAG: class I SAM-dependent RNA methyltransferase, partial [Oscillospiraceae bacterium]|nr:class I SAM-dependent RNA methyltransferase [Oscillospiraceae bacterium]